MNLNNQFVALRMLMGLDEPICMIDVDAGNIVYYYHFDGLGSVAALSDVNNVIVERYSYDVFGATTIYDVNSYQISISDIGNPYTYTARRIDNETDLYYYRARMYNSAIGRFLQTDPIGYNDGLNVYAYCGNNPLVFVDPLGLCKGGKWLDRTQLALDGAGMFPALGIFPDAINTVISVGRGNWGDALFNAGAMIPIFGQGSTGAKWAKRALQNADEAAVFAKKASKRLLPSLKMESKQFGKKIGKHAQDFGLDASDPASRNFIHDRIENIVHYYDRVKQGSWRGGATNNLFFSQEKDVVVTKPDGTFVTILKDGVNNKYYKGAGGL